MVGFFAAIGVLATGFVLIAFVSVWINGGTASFWVSSDHISPGFFTTTQPVQVDSPTSKLPPEESPEIKKIRADLDLPYNDRAVLSGRALKELSNLVDAKLSHLNEVYDLPADQLENLRLNVLRLHAKRYMKYLDNKQTPGNVRSRGISQEETQELMKKAGRDYAEMYIVMIPELDTLGQERAGPLLSKWYAQTAP